MIHISKPIISGFKQIQKKIFERKVKDHFLNLSQSLTLLPFFLMIPYTFPAQPHVTTLREEQENPPATKNLNFKVLQTSA